MRSDGVMEFERRGSVWSACGKRSATPLLQALPPPQSVNPAKAVSTLSLCHRTPRRWRDDGTSVGSKHFRTSFRELIHHHPGAQAPSENRTAIVVANSSNPSSRAILMEGAFAINVRYCGTNPARSARARTGRQAGASHRGRCPQRRLQDRAVVPLRGQRLRQAPGVEGREGRPAEIRAFRAPPTGMPLSCACMQRRLGASCRASMWKGAFPCQRDSQSR